MGQGSAGGRQISALGSASASDGLLLDVRLSTPASRPPRLPCLGPGLRRISGATPAPRDAPQGGARKAGWRPGDEPQHGGAPGPRRPGGLRQGRPSPLSPLVAVLPARPPRAFADIIRPCRQLAESPPGGQAPLGQSGRHPERSAPENGRVTSCFRRDRKREAAHSPSSSHGPWFLSLFTFHFSHLASHGHHTAEG